MNKTFIFVGALALLLVTSAFADFDLGDLPPCNYPTYFGNPAHSMSGKAWLGTCVTQEDDPHGVNEDGCDDGIQFVALPWTPCTPVQVVVTVTAGPNYNPAQPLYVNGWKDGNLDGDFCDELCGGTASEWIVQDELVVPGQYTFTFADPGVLDMGVYDGVFRFRLTGRAIGRFGFGFYDPFDCPGSPVCGNFGADSLGEVEDYWVEDAQLPVSFGNFDAVPGDRQVQLSWNTFSESNNDHFEILRDGMPIASVTAAGNSVTERNYSYVDNAVINGMPYTYTLVSVDANGNRDNLSTKSATPTADNVVVSEFALHQNYPNPFNPTTEIRFDIAEASHVSLTVFDLNGRLVATLVNGNLAADSYNITFDASSLPTGTYLYRLEAGSFVATQKMLLIK